jgi:hypothetical protein
VRSTCHCPQDRHAGDDQRPRPHGLRGLHLVGRRKTTPTGTCSNHLQREAFYGTAVAQSVGTSPTEAAIQFQRDQEAANSRPPRGSFSRPGWAPPNGGPDAVLLWPPAQWARSTRCQTPEQARAAVRRMALGRITHVKLWFRRPRWGPIRS